MPLSQLLWPVFAILQLHLDCQKFGPSKFEIPLAQPTLSLTTSSSTLTVTTFLIRLLLLPAISYFLLPLLFLVNSIFSIFHFPQSLSVNSVRSNQVVMGISTNMRAVKCYDDDNDDVEGLLALHREWCTYSAGSPTDRNDKYNSLKGIGDGWWDETMAEESESCFPFHLLPPVDHKQAMKMAMKTAMSNPTMAIAKA